MHAPAKRFQFLRVVGLIDPLVGRKLGRDSSPASIVSKPTSPPPDEPSGLSWEGKASTLVETRPPPAYGDLEQEVLWHDFHEKIIPAAAYLSAQVLPRYIVLIAAVLEAPTYVVLPELDIERESFLEVRDRQSRELITVVEVLSPTNKRPGDHRGQYLKKRADLLRSPVHLVEIDLLRCGPPLPPTDRPGGPYSVLVSRAQTRPRADFWPFGLRDPLPTVPIPLKGADADARLDLRAILDRVYDESGYGYFLYDHEPDPALNDDDANWARSLIAAPLA